MPKLNPNIMSTERVRSPYSPVDQLRLHASERDEMFDSDIWTQYLDNLRESDVRLYPNNDLAVELVSEIAQIKEKHINIYDGSDRALRDIFMCFTNGGKVISTDPAFPMYRVYAQMFGATYETFTYTDPKCPIHDIIKSLDDTVDIVVLSNPLSPVGDVIEYHNLVRLYKLAVKYDFMLVMDEAYIEYSNGVAHSSYLEAIHSDNVVVVRTLSKGLGSAGIRVGYTIGSEATVEILERASGMNYVTGPSIAWMKTMLQIPETFTEYYMRVITCKYYVEHYCRLNSIKYIPSYTNFMHVEHDFGDGILTKKCKMPWSDIEWTRLSIPADDENYELLLERLRK